MSARAGLAADVVYLEKELGQLAHLPIEELRLRLGQCGVVLPPRA